MMAGGCCDDDVTDRNRTVRLGRRLADVLVDRRLCSGMQMDIAFSILIDFSHFYFYSFILSLIYMLLKKT